MPLLADESLVRFADRETLLGHVRRRGTARRRRSRCLRGLAFATAVVLAAGVPISRLVNAEDQQVETVPPAGAPKSWVGGPTSQNVRPGDPTRPGPRDPGASDTSEGLGTARPGPEADQTGGGSTATTTIQVPPRPDGDDECAVKEVEATIVAAGDGPSCYFYASSEGGYEATGDWRISIRRGDADFIYSSFLGSPSCGRTGTIQPGDYVEVVVKAGTAGAGRSYGTNCGS